MKSRLNWFTLGFIGLEVTAIVLVVSCAMEFWQRQYTPKTEFDLAMLTLFTLVWYTYFKKRYNEMRTSNEST